MSTNAPHAPGEFGEPPARTPGTGCRVTYCALKALKALASLQLTVVLFVFGMLLIFFGTLAQIDYGIWTVVDKYFYSWAVLVPTDLIHKFLNVFWKEMFPDGESAWSGSFPLPGGKMIGLAMLINLLAAHALRFRLTWKRLGIFLIHGGLILLFVGEFITREHAIEQRMTIEQGKSTNYTEDARHVEYVFIDRSDPHHDTEVTIPEHVLQNPRGRITHPDLPVDVEVVGAFMINAMPERPRPDLPNPADSGLGKQWVVTAQKEVSGLDEQKNNFPAVYLKFYKKGTDEVIGTYLASQMLGLMPIAGPDRMVLDGKAYEMELRFKRYYKPYRIYLDKFSFDRYIGTGKAKNYSSDVRLADESNGIVIPYRISMNNPLRYNGETFYQQSFDKSETTTILQVVKNPGWMLPYVAVVVVGFGLILHFSIYLIQFLLRGAPARAAATIVALAPAAPGAVTTRSAAVRYFPWIMLGIAALYLLSVAGRMGPPKEPVDLDAFGRMPVVDGGRVKPLDTVARIYLRMISGREEFYDEKDKKQPAIRWYLEVITGGTPQQQGPVWKYQVIRIDNEAVLRELKLENREGFRYSMEELAPQIDLIEARMRVARKKVAEGKKLDQTETKFKELHDRMSTFMELASLGGPLLLPPNGPDGKWESLGEFRAAAQRDAVLAGMRDAQKRLLDSKKLDNLTPEDERILADRFDGIDLDRAKLNPAERAKLVAGYVAALRRDPAEVERNHWDWMRSAAALLPGDQQNAVVETYRKAFEARQTTNPAAVTWNKIVTAYRDKKPNDFASAVAEYRTTELGAVPASDLTRTRVEIAFNRFAPFYQCIGLYVLVFVLSVLGFTQSAAGRPQWAAALRRSALWVLLLALVIHGSSLFIRMYLMDRPLVFVTNLYSSAIFIGCGCVALCFVLEMIFPLGVGNVVGAILGLATTIVAHNIANNDTLEMMEAVLDTNFWLATHVTTVTFGYVATFVAGFLGALYVLQMLAAVVRDSFESTGEPTVGALMAFGAAATGVVGIPLFFLWFATSALVKFEFLPHEVLWGVFGLVVAAGVMYAIALMLLRVGSEGVDAQGKPIAGRVPNIAKPIVALALTPERSKIFGQMVYGVVCFATLLSFVGTVLGGIWADQSWGRFWGWDPKENGAVLIVLWNSLILHARWCGLVKDRGVAVLAIFGNVMTAWSWFGTNQLSIGLHAYGFDSRLADGCFNFWVSQLFIMSWGLIPKRFWASATRPVSVATAAAQKPNTTSAPPPPSGPSANGQAHPPSPNGNGQANGHHKGQSRRDKKKKRHRDQ
jgi:ABC-type transport system involved in cytochrome c biogenesis permease subunit